MDLKSKILVTGGSGMIGSALVRLLTLRGYLQVLAPTRAALDLRDASAVQAFFAQHRPDIVFHLAAHVGGIYANATFPGQFLYDNTAMQLNVIEACRIYGVSTLLFPGSACTYPKFAPQPVHETAFLSGTIEPTNLAYAGAKINGIIMAQSYARQYGLRVILPMPANAYGPGDDFSPEGSHVIPALMQRLYQATLDGAKEVVIWGSGSPLREFLYADDAADAFLFLAQHYFSPDIINVGTGQEISIRDLALQIASLMHYSGDIVFDATRPDGAPRKLLDSSKLHALGWKPNTTLPEGLKRVIAQHFTMSARKQARSIS